MLASVHSPLFSSSGAFHVNLALLATFLSTGALKKKGKVFFDFDGAGGLLTI